MTNVNTPDKESLRTEYVATQDAYLHYDNFSWQVGSILMAGTFVFWGLLLDKSVEPPLLGMGALLVALLMSVWLLYTHHCRQIYLSKLDRLHEIEDLLGMEQHRRWLPVQSDNKPLYRVFGPHGYHLDLSIYVITSAGASAIGTVKFGLNPWLALPLPVIALVLLWVGRNEYAVKRYLAQRRTATSSNTD